MTFSCHPAFWYRATDYMTFEEFKERSQTFLSLCCKRDDVIPKSSCLPLFLDWLFGFHLWLCCPITFSGKSPLTPPSRFPPSLSPSLSLK